MSGNGRQPSRQRIQGTPFPPQYPPESTVSHGAAAVPAAEQPPNAPYAGPAAPEPLYGLAADLAGVVPSEPVGPGGGTLNARPPARLGSARSNRMVQPTRAPGVRLASAANAVNAAAQPAADPFAVLDAQRHQQPPGPDDEVQYGLALELLNNQEPGFPGPEALTEQRGRWPRGDAPVARLGATSSGAPPSNAVPLDPFTVMELAASQAGLPEPDYGLVAELRNREPPDPFASDYGLAAEVARRRSRSPSPLARGGGVLPPLRARRRLDPVMPPPDSEGGGDPLRNEQGSNGLADEIAARQRQDAADMAEPFGAAARVGELDPFALADEQLKVPRELLEPYEASQQELPGEDVRLKTPADGAADASAFTRDEQQYGIAEELGAEPATATVTEQQVADPVGAPLPGQAWVAEQGEPPEPPGHKYVFDEDTGMLTTTAGGQGDGGRVARQYIEDEATGIFYKLQSKRRKLFGLLRRKPHAVVEEDEEEEDDKGFRGRLRRMLVVLTNICNVLGMFAQGLVGGFALLNFFMTYMLYGSSNMRKFLSYYAPLAQNSNRIYYALITLAVISSTSRLAYDKLRNFEPRRLQLGPVDYVQLLLYVIAYVTSVLCTPLDDELTYEANRNPRFYELTWTSGFKRRVSLWHSLNIVRTLCVGLAWLLTCYQTSPYIFETTLRADLRAMRRQQALLQSLSGSGAPQSALAHKTA